MYDVSKVLMTIGLIQQVHLNEHKRSALEWIGPENMKETINRMLKEGHTNTEWLNLFKILFDKSSTSSCSNDISDVLGKRSFNEETTDEDNSIEKLLNTEEKFIWPRVNKVKNVV